MNIAINKTAALSLLLTLLPAAANAAPTTGTPVLGPNGHYYEFVAASQITWDTANSAASNLTFAGIAGHLATITSAAEDDFVETARQNTPLGEVWVGGFQNPITTTDAKLNWTWINNELGFPGNNSGPEYANWNLGIDGPDDDEPNDNYGPGSEQHLTVGLGDSRKWNDEGITPATGLGNITGYVIEYDLRTNADDDSAEAKSGETISIAVLANDDVDIGVQLITIVSDPVSGGTADVIGDGEDSIIEYKSGAGFGGMDTFVYQVTAINGLTDTATVTVDVSTTVSVVVPGLDQLFFNQANVPGSVNPLTASFRQVLEPGEVVISCCLVDDTREGAGKKALGYYSPVNFDIGLAIKNQVEQGNLDCADMVGKILPGKAIMRPWHRGVPESQGIYDLDDPVIAGPNDLGVCVIESTVVSDDVVFSAEQAKNLLGYKLNYRVPTLQYRPITIGVALDPTEGDSPNLTSWTADTDESRSAKKYSKNVMVVNAWHAWLFNPSRPYLSQMADAILDSIEDARSTGEVDEDFLDDLKLQMQVAKAYIWLPRKANDAVLALENATRMALLIEPYERDPNPYLGSTENWRGLWIGRTMALKFAACSELLHTFSSASTLDGACKIANNILAEMPDLPGFPDFPIP